LTQLASFVEAYQSVEISYKWGCLLMQKMTNTWLDKLISVADALMHFSWLLLILSYLEK